MTRFEKLVNAIEEEMLKVGTDKIDYSDEKDNRFFYGCYTYIESKNNVLCFTFDAYDCGTGFHVNNVKFDNGYLTNLIEKLNKHNFRHE